MARLALEIATQIKDPIRAVELITGKDYHDFTEEEDTTSFLIMHLSKAIRNRENISRRDTFRDMPYTYFKDVVFENGFDRVLKYDFLDTYEPERKEEFSIWARKDLGMLLTSESYYGKKEVNSFNLYYELPTIIDGRELDKEESEQFWHAITGTSNSPCLDKDKNYLARTVNFSDLNGLINHINTVEICPVKPNVPWKFHKEHFLWLCDYSETRGEYDYAEINQRKISQLPKDVQQMIGAI